MWHSCLAARPQVWDLLECTAELEKQWKKCVIFTSEDGLRLTLKSQIKGRSCPGSLSQVGVLHGTSCRWCLCGGCKRTVEPARHLSCCPAASLSTSTHFLRWTHTELCNRCWSEERSMLSYNQCDYWVLAMVWEAWLFPERGDKHYSPCIHSRSGICSWDSFFVRVTSCPRTPPSHTGRQKFFHLATCFLPSHRTWRPTRKVISRSNRILVLA